MPERCPLLLPRRLFGNLHPWEGFLSAQMCFLMVSVFVRVSGWRMNGKQDPWVCQAS